VADAGLLALHVPVADMSPPTIDQIRTCISAIERAHARGMGVAVHCAAGLGRTGTVLACYLVSRGMGAAEAIGRMRELRPGSVETSEQEEVVFEFARSRAAS
jgi:atypical dual specificity phosphatase